MPDAINHFKLERSASGSEAFDPTTNVYGTLNQPITVVDANIPASVVVGNPPMGHYDASSPIPSPTFYYRLTAITDNLVEIPYNVVLRTSSQPFWEKHLGGSGTDYANSVTVNAAGDIFVTGVFSNSVDFGGVTLTSLGGYDVFVVKYNSIGTLVWAKRYGSNTASEVGLCIKLDPSGNIFVSGTLVGGSLMKLDSSGNLIWTKMPVAGYPTNVIASSIYADSAGNIVATGSFNSLFPGVDFGDGHLLYSQVNSTDTYLAKYSPTGTCLWAQKFANSGDVEYGTGVVVNRSDDTIYLTGYAFNGIDLGGGMLSNPTWGAMGYLGKFASNGTYIWGRRVGSKDPAVSSQSFGRARSLAIDNAGNLIVGGEFWIRANLAGEPMDSGNAYIDSTAVNYDSFVVKYLGNTGAYVWGRRVVGDRDEKFLDLAADSQNNVIAAGNFRGIAHFDGVVAANQFQLTATGPDPSIYDVCVAKYTIAGVPVWAKKFGGGADDFGNSVAVDPTGNPVVAGSFAAADIFLARLNGATGGLT